MPIIKIVTDSSAALTAEEIKKYDIEVVPLQVSIDDHNYLEGIEISHEEFFKKMETAKKLPTSSQPAVINFYDAYEHILEKSPNVQIISIHLSEALSGTGQTAAAVAKDFKGKVIFFDSHSIDRGLSFQVLAAAKMAQEGKNVNEIFQKLNQIAKQTRIFLSLESLKNLIAGGRISRASGLVGSLLNIKVGLEFIDDSIKTVSKGRGEKSINKFYDQVILGMQKLTKVHAIGISHVDDPDGAKALADRLRKLFPNTPIVTLGTSPIIATHTGIGTLCILYYGE
ncbi:DegV family protein [Oenococcus sicerae]|mgnify:CR=1 FL=1|uniref:DegV family protein n=1 Tax=Oenococcus sicerae TaxID=2203724 RepID=A0AAJ1RBA6_9LACO|nr:DegV family protein [Oenococcus sicerae]MDN6899760.1 DegV family protein [Oenococcus sicerae]QAS70449.1 DegV family protein [Oenococcus sicerae]VDK14243.1 DegV domain-containing protein [Oenococcus sicerae]